MTRTLEVYLNLKHVGTLTETNGKSLSFTYSDDVSTPISLSMPIENKTYNKNIVTPFFENLLPEGDIIKTIASVYLVSEKNPFSLLNIIGEDCAGAIHLSNKNIESKEFPYPKELSTDDFHSLLHKYDNGVPYYQKGMRLSLAGAQNKTTLILRDDIYYIPNFKFPSTHIIKFINPIAPNILLNEFFCTELAKSLGINVSSMEIKKSTNYLYLLIERFDRIKNNADIKRIHQEDFCQILSVKPTNKYQEEGGPSFIKIVDALKSYSSSPLDLILLAKISVYNYLIGNCDYHGKNLSLLHINNSYKLSPFYDLVSTRIYEELSHNMAMSINKKYDFDKINKQDIEKELTSWGLNGPKLLKKIVKDFKYIINNAKEIQLKENLLSESKEINNIIRIIEENYKKLT
ncbi:type II toxin-antitoxin system HipA family toxin [Haploplasma axanthum]|uniref:Serine/threonine-protein kinase HipA n=1 Tax=Haploplasma axanthum TaxID=29552 RepID=A0A449BC27_HAPAX|nr:type II toxin-antitoxin system HipA family toxin [Haploplasma axanthum]VEU79997.1 Serine/threonine-protein kinase HipA [Haploplasma axanthum]